ncbi:hypothetical protein [Thermaerobacter subterraneus]|uniref:hypothetical protein n=1 Tax=Thermaerobacter subterraneus TaxID=175696 RepID=UPI0001EB4B5B|nr:hypothetical protein [Thermaerobacter subterraneus]
MVVPYLMVLLPQNLAVSTLTAAALVFVVKFSVQASSVIGGPLADRLGTRRMLVLGLLLRAAGMAAFALTRHVGCHSRPARWQAWAAGSMHPPPAEPSVP